ncbi:MAG: patatin-like phospholipase family protein [Pseudomonadota bacterium]
MKRYLGIFFIAVLLFGCAHYPANPKLDAYDKTKGYRFDAISAPAGADRLFVILAFSGGGTRAAALSYGVLETLRDTRFTWQGAGHDLLDEVDVISSVSGGSFTSAFYAQFGRDIFKNFESKFLYRDIQGELEKLVLMPTSWLKLASPDYSRIDLAADFYNREIFEGKQFGDLIRRNQRPMAIINATDMTVGAPFTFIQSQFDPICSDLSGVSLARAVAASSCFPVAFAPLTVNNYAGSCRYSAPPWVELALEDLQLNPPRYERARVLQSYLDGANRPYLHLLDGGVADNIGLRVPLASLRSNDPDLSVLRKINQGAIDLLVVIIVDAKTNQESDIDKTPSPPGLSSVLGKIATVPLDNYSFDTVQALRDEFAKWQSDSANYVDCMDVLTSQCPGARMPFPPPRTVKLFPVYVGFDQIADPARRRHFQTMKTSFHLPDTQVTELRQIARELLEHSDAFNDLKDELKATMAPAP